MPGERVRLSCPAARGELILLSRYLPGQGILPHTDGPAYEPLVATLSLGSHTVLTLTPAPHSSPTPTSPTDSSSSSPAESDPTPSAEITLLLPPRSLLLLSTPLYTTHHHSILPLSFDPMPVLRACANWESYWACGAGLEGFVPGPSWGRAEGAGELREVDGRAWRDVGGGLGSENGSEEEVEEVGEEEARRELVARRRLVEEGSGWERGRRVSLTCRRVSKVRKGIKLG